MNKEHIDKIIKINENLEIRFTELREKWLNNVNEIINLLSDVKNITTIQIKSLSFRQILVDKIAELYNSYYKTCTNYDSYYKAIYQSFPTEMNNIEKDRLTKNYISILDIQKNLIHTHIDFYKETIRTIDNLNYAVKNKIVLTQENYM